MTYGGMRGAIALYFASTINSTHKDQLTSITLILIVFTIVGMGSTTTCFLRILNSCCSKDKILQEADEKEDEVQLLDNEDDLKSDGLKPARAVSTMEVFDDQYLKSYFVKEYKRHNLAHQSSIGGEGEEDSQQSSELQDDVSRLSSMRGEIVNNFFERNVRGGDMSPYRTSRLLFRQKTIRKVSSTPGADIKKGIVQSLLKKKTSMFAGSVEKFEGPAIELPGLTTTKAQHSKLTKELDGGFSSLFSPQEVTPGSAIRNDFNAPIFEVTEKADKNDNINEELKDVVEEMAKDTSKDIGDKDRRSRYKTKKLSTVLEEDEAN